MNSRAVVVVLIVLMSLMCSLADPEAAGDQLSDAAARTLIDRWFELSESSVMVGIKLGPLVVVSPLKVLAEQAGPEESKGVLTPDVFKGYVAWAELGVISIAVDPRYEAFKSGKSFSWDQYMERIRGTDTKAVASSTPRGDALMAKAVAKYPGYAEPRGHALYILPGPFRVTRIVQNIGYRGSAADWRLVSFLYDATWEPVFKEWRSLIKHPVTDKRKGRVLLRYDPFKPAWGPVTMDVANADAEFDASSVPAAVRENQLVPVQK